MGPLTYDLKHAPSVEVAEQIGPPLWVVDDHLLGVWGEVLVEEGEVWHSVAPHDDLHYPPHYKTDSNRINLWVTKQIFIGYA